MELGPVDRITTGTQGEPGSRTFFLQARHGVELVTVIVEKQQVQLLAASVLELLADVTLETEAGPDESEMELEAPLEPRWRAGRLSIGYDHERDLFMLEITEFEPEADEGAEPTVPLDHEPETLRLWATRAQMLALSRHGAAVAERGRPLCQYCGNPLEPEGHACPAMNGHSTRRN